MIGVLLFASPTIAVLIKPPAGEQFSVIYVLGPNHTFDGIPFDIKPGVTYSVFLGVTNYMGSSIYYTCSVKLASQNDSLPDQTLGTPSSLPALYEYKTFLADGETWETPLTFQVNDLTFANGLCKLYNVAINGVDISVNQSTSWDSIKKGYYFNLFVELSIYNSTLGIAQYNNRFVSMFFNMTQ